MANKTKLASKKKDTKVRISSAKTAKTAQEKIKPDTNGTREVSQFWYDAKQNRYRQWGRATTQNYEVLLT